MTPHQKIKTASNLGPSYQNKHGCLREEFDWIIEWNIFDI